MKKIYLFIFIAFLIQANIYSQSCLPEGITFITQAQIDSFQINYPGCSEIEGDVLISGNDITNLNGLSVLTSLGSNLFIEGNSSLINLTGLQNITSINGTLRIADNATLMDLTGMGNLTSIAGSLLIRDFHKLKYL